MPRVMSINAITPLSIFVIGGGIGGLTLSILLAQDGHQVTTLEHKDAAYESSSTGGIGLTWNAVRWIQAMGLQPQLTEIAESGHYYTAYEYKTGKLIRNMYKEYPHWHVHRGDLLKILRDHALSIGVNIRFKTTAETIHGSGSQPTVTLMDGTSLQSDLIVGADGVESNVRRAVFPDSSPRLTSCVVMLMNVSHSAMLQTQATTDLYNTPPLHCMMSPGRCVISWTTTKRQVYHAMLCDFEYGDGGLYGFEDPPSAPYISNMTDMSRLRHRWSDHEPRLQHILDHATSYTRWKVAEVPPLPSYTSAGTGGRIVLLGDAAHAIRPFAGQGANMAIEDAKALATVLALVKTKDEIHQALNIYDAVRIPRLEGFQEIVNGNVQAFDSKDRAEIDRRDKALATDPGAGASALGKPGNQCFNADRYRWTEGYDVQAEVLKAWEQRTAVQSEIKL